MIVIREEQVRMLEQSIARELPARIEAAIRRDHGALVEDLDAAALASRIHEGIQRARGHGFETLGDIRGFVTLLFSLGWEFDGEEPYASILAAYPSHRAIGELALRGEALAGKRQP